MTICCIKSLGYIQLNVFSTVTLKEIISLCLLCIVLKYLTFCGPQKYVCGFKIAPHWV